MITHVCELRSRTWPLAYVALNVSQESKLESSKLKLVIFAHE